MNPEASLTLSCIITKEERLFVATCPQLDVVSQGTTIDEAHANLKEAVELWLSAASQEEVEQRLSEGGKVVALMPLEVFKTD